MARSVWIVRTEDPEAPEPVLAVLDSAQEADAFVHRVLGDFPDGSLVYAQYGVGWTFDGGSARYTTGGR